MGFWIEVRKEINSFLLFFALSETSQICFGEFPLIAQQIENLRRQIKFQ
jgi:hypothetical protein